MKIVISFVTSNSLKQLHKMTTQTEITTKELLLQTSKKMNSALAKKKYEVAYNLLQIANSLRIELNQPILNLLNLESRFKN